jgi:circadian clock protein KaiB
VNARAPGPLAPEPVGQETLPAYELQLYVTGHTARSIRAVENVRRFCEELLAGRYTLNVVDLYQQPELAAREQLIAAPTLVKRQPLPVRRMVGDMSDRNRMLAGLGVVT